MNKGGKISLAGGIAITLSVLVLILAGYIWFRFYFVFGEGVKSGNLNYLVYKGYVFKTYEGKVILFGYNSRTTNNGVQSNEFRFSVADKQVAEKLMRCTGKNVELHYKEYKGALPWRGTSRYVVDEILSVGQDDTTQDPQNLQNLPIE